MSNQICTLEIVIDGIPYFYEAHSYERCAEILASQMRVLDSGETNQWGSPIYSHHLDSFTIHHFVEV